MITERGEVWWKSSMGFLQRNQRGCQIARPSRDLISQAAVLLKIKLWISPSEGTLTGISFKGLI
jgi:hypothetical protein